LRPARIYYERALELKPGEEKLMQRIVECDRMLAFERKVIWILGALTLVVILTLYLF